MELVDVMEAWKEMCLGLESWADFAGITKESLTALAPEHEKIYQFLLIRELRHHVGFTLLRKNYKKWGYRKRTHLPTGKRHWWLHLGWYSILIL